MSRISKPARSVITVYGAPVLRLLRRVVTYSSGTVLEPTPFYCPVHGSSLDWVCCCVHVFEQISTPKHRSGRWLLCGRCHGLTRSKRPKHVPDTKIFAVCRKCLENAGALTVSSPMER